MTPENAAREWLTSGEYERLAREVLPRPLTIEEYTRGEPQRSMNVDTMHNLFERIFVAGVEWARREKQ